MTLPDPYVEPYFDPIDELARETQRQVLRMRAQKDARRKLAAEAFEPFSFPDDFETELSEPDPDIKWTIDGLHTVGGNSILIAQFKTGKTTMMHNLIRSLVDGEPFLGEHAVREIQGRVLYLNFEVEASLARRDLRRIGFANPKKLTHWPLRGRRLDVRDDATAEWLIKELKRLDIEVLAADPFSGAYKGKENDNSEQAEFVERIDQIKHEAGVVDFMMPAHTGRGEKEYGAEHVRGGTKLDDWADHRWILTRKEQVRYFWAQGRGGEDFGDERALSFEPTTERLTYSHSILGTRKTADDQKLRDEILVFIEANPGCTQNAIESGVDGNAAKKRAVVKKLRTDAKIGVVVAGKSHLHFVAGHSALPAPTVGLEDV